MLSLFFSTRILQVLLWKTKKGVINMKVLKTILLTILALGLLGLMTIIGCILLIVF